jgi:uncharacterized protein YyaL (SSP411 family)
MPRYSRLTGVLMACLTFGNGACQTETSHPAHGEGERAEAGADDEESATGASHTNRLIHETSPYLLQHAHNPVDWYAWGPEAFARAKKEDKPIFLSVGYSTCYWCHVMERESFEREDVAAIINQYFIPIKVDREERPDVDEQFMLATQLVTGRGGWPNSVWLTPDGRPWMAGTYFPREQFKQLLRQLAEVWEARRDDVNRQADQLAGAIRRVGSGEHLPAGRPITQDLIVQAIDEMRESFDSHFGGFGTAPKFPPHGNLRLLVDQHRRDANEELLQMIRGTLDGMFAGGVRDHVGGGFHRYSTDQEWFLPHFEKMLYDNAQLMRAYTDGYLLTGDERYRKVVQEIFTWLTREMTAPAGGFYSAIDAESEQEEGKFYVWHREEVAKVLGEDDAQLFAQVYNVLPAGNFVEEATGQRPGTNILHLPVSIPQVAQEQDIDPDELRHRLGVMREKLLAVRNRRTYPHLDDKVLTSWNALMIDALAYAGRQLEEPRYTEAAVNAAEFILREMMPAGQLMRTYRADQAKLPGYLDDYAFLTSAMLTLHTTTAEEKWLAEAQRLADTMLSDFEDERDGGFFFSTKDHSDILQRSKNQLGGGNIPSANGVAAKVLLQLHRIRPEPKYEEAARRTLEALSAVMWQSPANADSLVLAAAQALADDIFSGESRPVEVVGMSGAAQASDAEPDARFEQEPVVAELYASRLSVRPGQSMQVAVALDIGDGWHLYGHNPDADFIVTSTVECAENSSFRIANRTIPAGTRMLDKTADCELLVYTDRIWFRFTLACLDDATPGEQTLEFQVTTQACDDQRCLAPASNKLLLRVTIDPQSEATGRHPAVFGPQPSN